MEQLPELLTVPEVASALRINPETVRAWARDGRLRPVPLPTRVLRFRREDVEAILAGTAPTGGVLPAPEVTR